MKNLYTILDKPSYCVDEYIDLSTLRNSYQQIADGIKLAKDSLVPSNPPPNAVLQPIEIINIYKEFKKTDEYKDLLASFHSDMEILAMLCDKHDLVFPSSQLFLRAPAPGYRQHYEERRSGHSAFDREPMKFFPTIKDWSINSGVFESVSLIVMFITNTGAKTYAHRDYNPDDGFIYTQGLWINLFEKKKFYVLDNDYNKHYVKGEANLFETCSLHGSDPASEDCFSIRIEGTFTTDFLNKTGLNEYYK